MLWVAAVGVLLLGFVGSHCEGREGEMMSREELEKNLFPERYQFGWSNPLGVRDQKPETTQPATSKAQEWPLWLKMLKWAKQELYPCVKLQEK